MNSVEQIRSELRYLVRELGLLDKNCWNSGLSLSQAHLLTYLSKNGSTPFSELCIQLNADKASLSRTINKLVENGDVQPMPHPHDKRQKYYQITPAGSDTLQCANHAANHALGDVIDSLADDAQAAVINGLRTLRLSAFHHNTRHQQARVQVEALNPVYRAEVEQLVMDVFAQEQNIPPALIPFANDSDVKWWVARSGEYILGAVAAWREGDAWHWGRFAVNRQFRGLGIGKSLALASLTELLATEPEILIEARDTTVNIVRQLGGEVLGEAFDFYGMPVTPMRLTATRFRANQQPM
ncbi:GNAT family N-acetyltransferase [Vibrio fluvialis]|uniref:GNAT family N-acetyltransferase n=1 Tax=Vibrio fluvialis TaxID=676 RepID=UPI000C21FB6E|nr:GNAT family N-acetyltransferase [Vibrio fluvialis]EKO3983491.1 GNAT family N-acetyltransferase [Vibrio fluvialis]MBY7826596.1 GNAT family N-acetyltransferase [Vibrio fluvialis]MBY7886031.1 GNAT family N-acetyltransferase [Vibrio fluvialis]MBY7929056.1 GNAT family N-acetyltransferase [Vibrio fluvialis]MBY8010567.1 GNAT family N-acetyltransferase [Vibrio fluvialis]